MMERPVKKLALWIPVAVCLAALAVSVICYVTGTRWQRRVMYFPQFGTERVYAEPRLVPREKEEGDQLRVFVEELLLGPQTNRLQPLFDTDTELEFCMVRDGSVFVGLSKKALYFSGETADSKTGIAMLKRNIVSNFTSIDTVEVYIDSVSTGQTDF